MPEDHSKDVSQQKPADDRLDGWKRIAQYLNRNVRTLQRWESHEGLPIHRLMHDKQGTVYAYRSELDEWRSDRGKPANQGADSVTIRKPSIASNKRNRWLLLLTSVLFMALVVTWQLSNRQAPGIVFGEWDWVLITRFENRTGENVLDGTLEYALQRELANSSYVKVAPRERINDALALMKLSGDTEIDVSIGREISLRDGGIRMLITGRIEKLGNAYLLSVGLINPVDGVSLASLSSDVTNQDQILLQVRKLSQEVRAVLGESLAMIEATEQMLVKVTTPSLEALQLFSEANRMMSGPTRPQAIPVLEQAVEIDPDFASAHLLLVYLYRDRDQVDKARDHLEKAVALADQVSDRERLFILATYYRYLGEPQKELETYQLLLRLYPDHYWASGNVGNIYESMGRLDLAYPYKVQGAEWRPNQGWPYQRAAELALANNDPDRAEQYVQQASLFAGSDEYLRALLTFSDIFKLWIMGDIRGASVALEEFIASKSDEELVASGWEFNHTRSMLMALGRLERFHEIDALRSYKGWFSAMLDFELGKVETLDSYLQGNPHGFWAAALFAVNGQPDRAMESIEDPRAAESLPPPFLYRDWKNMAEGQVALAEGRYEDAVQLLSIETMMLNITAKYAHLFAMHSLARAYEALGNMDDAIRTLEDAAQQKPLTMFSASGTWFWQRNQYYLQRLYLETGQLAKAEGIREELQQVLQLADQGHPFLQPIQLPVNKN